MEDAILTLYVVNAAVLAWIGLKIRRIAVGRGYRDPTVAATTTVVFVVAFIIGLAGVRWALDEHWPVTGVAAMSVAPDLFMVGCAGLVALLPRRNTWEGLHASRFTFGVLRLPSAGLLVLALLAVEGFERITGAWLAFHFWTWLAVGAAMVVDFARREYRQQSTRADPAGNDTRPPVVYLRPFLRQTEIFSEKAGRLGWSSLRRWTDAFFGSREEVFLPFERFVEGAVGRHLGPFQVLGNPRDYLPHERARRTYSGEDWERDVPGLIDRAGCILTVPAPVCDSEALTFEFTYMLRSHATDRLFVVTSPYGPTRPPPLRMRIVNWLQAITPTPWERFGDDLNILGYQVPVDRPAAGTVLGFDSHGRAVEITTGARTPDGYILPIAERLACGAPAPARIDDMAHETSASRSDRPQSTQNTRGQTSP